MLMWFDSPGKASWMSIDLNKDGIASIGRAEWRGPPMLKLRLRSIKGRPSRRDYVIIYSTDQAAEVEAKIVPALVRSLNAST